MTMPSLRRVRNADDGLRQAQDAEDIIFKFLATKQIIDGNFLEGIVVAPTGTSIDHRLQRPLRGWILARKNDNQDIWELPTTTPSSTLLLRSTDDNVTISLWVF